jgi:protocatechuate 4,5-dioxygenase, beta chain
MARIIGGITTSHIPAIGGAISRGLQQDPYWKPFFDGYPPVRKWLDENQPDVAIIIYNDHGLNFFLDNLPTFAIGAAKQYRNEDEGWGLKPLPPFPGDPEFSWHLIESLVADEFDITICQDMAVDHGFAVPMSLLWGGKAAWPVRTVPLEVNTVQHPLPKPARCYKLGKALGRAIESYPSDIKVVVIGTGGLSHQLDGERAGFINKPFDLWCMDRMIDDPQAMTRLTVRDIVEKAGAQGIELEAWIAMRGAMEGAGKSLHRDYHIPISNTAAACMLMTPVGEEAAKAA